MTKPISITDEQISDTLYSSSVLSELTNIPKKEGLPVGIPKIDKDFNFPSGYYVIVGNPGTGKSWFALWLSRMFWKFSQMRSVYFSLEMPEIVVRARILQQWSDLTKTEFEDKKSAGEALDLMGKDVVVVNTFSDSEKKQTTDYFSAWIDKYYEIGYRIFHFDHLHELEGANDIAQNQGVTEKWGKLFEEICKKYPDIWLFIYAQPNGNAAKSRILRRTDISGSKAITQKCDYYLSLNRNIAVDEKTGLVLIDENERVVILYLDKTRYTERQHIGFKIYFSPTGNFYDYTEGVNE